MRSASHALGAVLAVMGLAVLVAPPAGSERITPAQAWSASPSA